jgi:hypothetical protein
MSVVIETKEDIDLFLELMQAEIKRLGKPDSSGTFTAIVTPDDLTNCVMPVVELQFLTATRQRPRSHFDLEVRRHAREQHEVRYPNRS